MAAVLPGQGDIIRRARFVAALRAVKVKHEKRITESLREIGEETLALLVAITPKDTGAAAGTTVGANRALYKWHPAFKLGLNIGNEVGDSGWQLTYKASAKKFAIINPMWNYYLKYVNYGTAKMVGLNFVETAATQLRAKLRAMR